MGAKFGFIVGAGLGYVLGTRAGRERYEKIKMQASKIRQSPLVAERMDQASPKPLKRAEQQPLTSSLE